jgi:flagellar assembly protein FliH
MEKSFWQVRTAESHLSNLLKKDLDPQIAVFGFPIIQEDSGGAMILPGADAENAQGTSIDATGQEEEASGPEMNAEELYRRKLLEIERRTQEIERDAYSQGFAQGEKDGLDYGQKSVQVVRSQLERMVQNMEALPEKVLQDYRDWLIRTSIGIARQIVKREIQISPEIVADTVRALIEEARDHSTLTVFLNANDLDIAEKKGCLTPGANGKHFILKADKDLERGGCRIESDIQLLDASIASLFENLENKLLGEK